MYTKTDIYGHLRPDDMKEECPVCRGRWCSPFKLYLRPDERKGCSVALILLIGTAVVVAGGLGLMYWILGNQIFSAGFLPGLLQSSVSAVVL